MAYYAFKRYDIPETVYGTSVEYGKLYSTGTSAYAKRAVRILGHVVTQGYHPKTTKLYIPDSASTVDLPQLTPAADDSLVTHDLRVDFSTQSELKGWDDILARSKLPNDVFITRALKLANYAMPLTNGGSIGFQVEGEDPCIVIL